MSKQVRSVSAQAGQFGQASGGLAIGKLVEASPKQNHGPVLQEACEILLKDVTGLDQAVGILEARLTPVLLPPGPPGNATALPVAPEASPVVNAIMLLISKIQLIQQRVDDISSRSHV